MELFKFKKKTQKKAYDRANQKSVIKCSICNGEQVAGFQNVHTGAFEEVALIRRDADLELFRKQYDITGEISKIY